MRKILVVLFMAAAMIVAGQQVALAQETNSSSAVPAVAGNAEAVAGASTSSPVFTPAQQEEAREALKVLGGAFGVAKQEPPQRQQATTVAEVADKALDMAANAVSAIAGKMEQVAPKVWEIMIRQQYAKAIGGVVVPLGTIIGLFVFILVMRYSVGRKFPKEERLIMNDRGDWTDYGWWWVFTTLIPSVLLVCFAIWFFNRAAESVMFVINPEFYAVRDLLQMLLSPGSIQ